MQQIKYLLLAIGMATSTPAYAVMVGRLDLQDFKEQAEWRREKAQEPLRR
jgi:hypothetical protein